MKYIQVGTYEYAKSRAPNVLFAAVSPCIAIGGIYENKGYLLHTQLLGLGNLDKEISPIFNDIKRDVKDKSRLKLYAAGGATLDFTREEIQQTMDEDVEEILKSMAECKKAVERRIEKEGLSDCIKEISWAGNYTRGQELYLYLREGSGKIINDLS